MNRMQNPNNQNNAIDNKERVGNNNVDPIRSRVDQELAKDLKKLPILIFN